MPLRSSHCPGFTRPKPFEAIESGALGYPLKNLSADQFFEMLDGLQRGEAALTRQTTTRLMKGLADLSPQRAEPVESLTEREIELLRLVVETFFSQMTPEKALAWAAA